MSIHASYYKHTLNFNFDAGTSRGVLRNKDCYFIKLSQKKSFGIGEAAPLKGLSIDYKVDFEAFLKVFIDKFNQADLDLNEIEDAIYSPLFNKWPSIRFAFETALLDLQHGGKQILFDNNFSRGNEDIAINGLIWMGDEAFMSKQIVEKLKSGYRTLKMKIGAIDFDTEIKLLKSIRANFDHTILTLRVDANGSFSPTEAKGALAELSKLDIHSIEQPIKANQWKEMAELCSSSPIPIALDEELIGISGKSRNDLLDTIKPAFIILKPSLLGGFKASDDWINLAEERNIKWWITSALESNIGLNAICQYTFEKNNPLPQGLGTGQLFTNNIPSPLTVKEGFISLDPGLGWDLGLFGDQNV